MCAPIHTSTRIYMHTHTHTHGHTYIRTCKHTFQQQMAQGGRSCVCCHDRAQRKHQVRVYERDRGRGEERERAMGGGREREHCTPRESTVHQMQTSSMYVCMHARVHVCRGGDLSLSPLVCRIDVLRYIQAASLRTERWRGPTQRLYLTLSLLLYLPLLGLT